MRISKSNFKSLTDWLKKEVKLTAKLISAQLQKSKQQEIAMQQQVQKQQQHLYLTQMLHNIQNDLFFVMHGSYYRPLRPIITTKNIRIEKYNFVGKSVVFTFSLETNTDEIIARTILDIIKNKINKDIEQCKNMLIHSFNGGDKSCFIHPYIIFGLFVIDIQQEGTDVLIKVITEYYP